MKKLDALATPPGKLSLGSKVEEAEEACNRYLGTTSSTFVTNATAGFEIAYKYANLKAGVVKNITSFGEGGILTTTIPDFGGELKRAHFLGLDFSCPNKDWLYNTTPIQGKEAPFVPGNSSTTEIQGLGLTLQVARNEEIIAIRRKAAAYLTERFAANDAITPQDLGNDEIKPTFHLYLLQIDPQKAGGDIQVLKKKLEQKGVTQIAHFGPLYRFKIVQDMGYDAEEIFEQFDKDRAGVDKPTEIHLAKKRMD